MLELDQIIITVLKEDLDVLLSNQENAFSDIQKRKIDIYDNSKYISAMLTVLEYYGVSYES